MFAKSELRQQLRHRRTAVPPSQRRQAAQLAAAHAASLPCLRRARRVALYLEYGSELGTQPLLDWLLLQGIECYVPKLRGDGGMHFLSIGRHTLLRRNAHGILEPAGRCLRRGLRGMDVVVMPLLGFDRQGNRLGSGGGYYDRALAGVRPMRRPLRLGYAYALQQTSALPADPWDVRLDAVVTEQGVMQWPTG